MSARNSIGEANLEAAPLVTKSPEGGEPIAGSGAGTKEGPLAGAGQALHLGMKYLFGWECDVRSTEPPPMRSGGLTRVQLAYLAEHSAVHSQPSKFLASWGRPPQPALASTTEAERKAISTLLDNRDRPAIAARLGALADQKRALLREHGGDWQGVQGGLLSGSDVMLVREDGVLTFDGRATLVDRSGHDEAGFLIDVAMSGVVDLRQALGAPSGRDAYESFCGSPGGATLYPRDGKLPVRLSLRFELSAEAGAAAEYAAKRYVLQSLDHWKFERLGRGQFVGLGTLTLEPRPFWPVKKLTLDVYEIDSLPEELPWKSSVLPS